MDDIFLGLGVPVILKESDDFLIIKETLTRMGVSYPGENVLYQSCHILHKRGQYAIMHFKELFILDGRESSIRTEDIARRNSITNTLASWELLDLVDYRNSLSPILYDRDKLTIIPATEKHNWNLIPKYTIGKKSCAY